MCGLPGSGKSTRAKSLECKFGAVRFTADECLNALSLDLWDEDSRAKIEALQWNLGQQHLAQGVSIIIEWGTWGRAERGALRVGAREVGAAVELHYARGAEAARGFARLVISLRGGTRASWV